MARIACVLYAARPVRTPSPLVLLFALLAGAAIGCSPRIGDGCGNSQNCSINGDRLCDAAQPGGACTILDCQADRCPDDAVCVRFNPTPPRRQIVACMRRCGGDGDCRTAEGYACTNEAELMTMGLFTEVVDLGRPDASFCVAGVVH